MAKNTQQPELSMVDQVRIRREKLAQLQQEGQNPFAQTKFEFTSNSAEIRKNFEQMEGKEVSVSGRLMTKRGMGKVMFCDLQDAAGRIHPHRLCLCHPFRRRQRHGRRKGQQPHCKL